MTTLLKRALLLIPVFAFVAAFALTCRASGGSPAPLQRWYEADPALSQARWTFPRSDAAPSPDASSVPVATKPPYTVRYKVSGWRKYRITGDGLFVLMAPEFELDLPSEQMEDRRKKIRARLGRDATSEHVEELLHEELLRVYKENQAALDKLQRYYAVPVPSVDLTVVSDSERAREPFVASVQRRMRGRRPAESAAVAPSESGPAAPGAEAALLAPPPPQP